MSTIYMSQLSTLPLMEGDQDQGLFPAFHIAKDPPILFPFMINSPVDQHQGQSYGDQHLRQQVFAESKQQFHDHMMMAGSSNVLFPRPSPLFRPTIQSIGSNMIQRSTYDPYDIENKRADGSTSRWAVAPPALKIMRKATSEHPESGIARKPRRRAQAHQDERHHQQQQQGIVRVCSDCNTTKTPLWRSGPCGPKSLCNACGIRQRKARRAMAVAAAAAAAGNGGASAVTVSVSQQTKQTKKEKRAEVGDQSLPFKKRCKMVAVDQPATAAKVAPAVAAPTKDDQDHDTVTGESVAEAPSLHSSGSPRPAMSFHAFPADEITDAAMLLMTLSCGLVRSELALLAE